MAVREGKDFADSKIVRSLYERALGVEYEEKRIVQDSDGKITKSITKRKALGSVAAMKIWLHNRQPRRWSEKSAMNNDDLNDKPLDWKTDAEIIQRAQEIKKKYGTYYQDLLL